MIQRAAKAGNMGTAIRVEEVLKKNEVDQKSLLKISMMKKVWKYAVWDSKSCRREPFLTP